MTAIENQRQSLEVTAAVLGTQQASILQQPGANATQAELATEQVNASATSQALQTQAANLQYFTAKEDNYCRDAPSPSYETHWQLYPGDTVQVFAKW